MNSLKSFWTQYFPPSPTSSESQVGPQLLRVFVVTGGNSGLGLELVKRLYPTGATIYLACRSKERAEIAMQKVIESTNESYISTPAKLKFLYLDLNDLSSIAKSAATFCKNESRLDILWNNAGIGGSPIGTTTRQGLEGHIGRPGSVRIVWTASLSIESHAPVGGIRPDRVDCGITQDPPSDYAQSKVGNWWLALEGARRCVEASAMVVDDSGATHIV
ncbi:hypothetical protein E8E15_002058 [Penicillium rubens]|nr:hypothetical protein E8E15_002058 [Penicillium rubens]